MNDGLVDVDLNAGSFNCAVQHRQEFVVVQVKQVLQRHGRNLTNAALLDLGVLDEGAVKGIGFVIASDTSLEVERDGDLTHASVMVDHELKTSVIEEGSSISTFDLSTWCPRASVPRITNSPSVIDLRGWLRANRETLGAWQPRTHKGS